MTGNGGEFLRGAISEAEKDSSSGLKSEGGAVFGSEKRGEP